MKNSKKGFASVFLLIAVGVAAVGGGYYYLQYKNKPLVDTTSNVKTIDSKVGLVENTASSTTDSNLKTYKNTEFGIEFKYPATYSLKENNMGYPLTGPARLLELRSSCVNPNLTISYAESLERFFMFESMGDESGMFENFTTLKEYHDYFKSGSNSGREEYGTLILGGKDAYYIANGGSFNMFVGNNGMYYGVGVIRCGEGDSEKGLLKTVGSTFKFSE